MTSDQELALYKLLSKQMRFNLTLINALADIGVAGSENKEIGLATGVQALNALWDDQMALFDEVLKNG